MYNVPSNIMKNDIEWLVSHLRCTSNRGALVECGAWLSMAVPRLVAALLLLLAGGPDVLWAVPGDVDPNFTLAAGTAANDAILAVQVRTNDGKIYIGGFFDRYNGNTALRIARLGPTGAFDPSFASPGVGSPVNELALQPDLKVVIGGNFTSVGNTSSRYVARLNDNGSLDTAFTTGLGTGADNGVDALAIQADGKIMVGGRFLNFAGVARKFIARLNADGTLDTSFDPGAGPNQPVTVIHMQVDGMILVGGNFTTFGGATKRGIARLNPNGSVDGGFNTGFGSSGGVNVILPLPDGKILIGGAFTFYDQVDYSRLCRLNANGSLDQTFFKNDVNSDVRGLTLQANGKILLGGVFSFINGVSRNCVARLNANGTHDLTFNPGTGITDEQGNPRVINGIAPDLEGKLVVVGSFNTVNGFQAFHINRLDTADPTPPLVVSNPVDVFIPTGSNATFAVTASGSAPLAYQWRFNGNPIANATNTALTITNAQAVNEGLYSVAVSNGAGSVTSSNALLTLGTFPFFVTPPVSLTNVIGANVAFTVVAGGTAPLFYQWFFGGAALPGQTNPTLNRNNIQLTDGGLYTIIVSNRFGAVTNSATLTVASPPAIVAGPNGGGPNGQPQSLTVLQGQNSTFSANAIGSAPLTYQWRFADVNIPGATNTSVTLTNTQTTQAGLYSVVISNPFGSTTSANATLTVLVPPMITTGPGGGGPDGQPQSLTVVQGQNATFSANAIGTAPLSYQWRFAGVNIPGANGTSLTLVNVVPSQAGLYSVVISNAGGTATSANATLTVLTPPTITPGANGGGPDGHPQSLTVVQGQNATFSVNATGTAPLTYQWRFGGVSIAGATNTSVTLTNVLAVQEGLYSVVISNSGGSTTSSNATLTVLLPPSIIVPPVSQTLTQGTTLNLSVTATGSPTLTYQWRFNGSTFPGATSPFLSLLNVQESAQGDYTVVVSNPYGSVTSVVAVVTVQSPPNIFDAGQPQPQTVIQGSNATFSVTAIGDAPLTYQWRYLGTNLPGATANPLVLTGVQTNQAGNYSVVVSNPFGSATSSNALLTVRVPPFIITQPAPATQTILTGGNASITVVAGGDPTLTYQWRLNGVNVGGATAATLTLIAVQTNQLGLYSVVVSNPYGSVTSSNATLDVKSPPSVVSQPQSLTVVQGSPASFSVTAGGDGPFTYQWRFGGVNIAGATAPSVGLASALTNDAGLYSVVISSPYGSVTSSNALLTVRVPPFIVTQPAPATQTVLTGGNASITVVAGGDPTLTYQWRITGVNVPGATAATLTLTAVQTNQLGLYSVVVSNPYGSVTSSNATLDVKTAPFVASQPQSLAVLVGSPASFSVTAGGDGPFTYQWRFGGVNITGATAPSVGLASAVTNDAGLYSVVISSPYGSVTSSNAALTVNVPPTIITHPQPLATVLGSNATFTVVATGAPTLAYQWRFNGATIAGANAASLTLVNVQANQVGLYSVVVTNPFGTATSTNAALTVHLPPAIAVGASQPQPQTVIQGSNATFSVTATGDAPLSYQWRLGGANLVGATNNPLVLTGVLTNQAGNYSVVVSNPYGSVTSLNALLTVRVPPFIITQPLSQTVNAGLTVSFAVLAGGDPTLTYQWRRNGNAIAGATSPTLTLVGVQPNQGGDYSVVVTNPYGTATSSNATLTVKTAPFVASHPQSLTVLKGTNASFAVAAGGDGPFTYQWLFAGGALAGATNNPLALTNVQTNQAGLYSVVITSPYGTATSSNATLTVLDPPVIVVQPVSAAPLVGENVTFFVGAIGRPTLNYQWSKNGVTISGATNLTLTLTNVSAADVANYLVKVTNTDGSATSVTVTLAFTQRTVQVVSTQVTSAATNFTPGTAVAVPVALLAEGGENRVTASVAYDVNKLTFVSVTASPVGATLAATNAAAQGLIGFDLALASGQSFTTGSNVVVFLNFTVAAGVTQSIASLMLQGTPVANQVLSTTGAPLPSYFISGAVILKSLTDYTLRSQTGATEEALPVINPAGSVSSLTFLRISFFDLGNDSLGNAIRLINATGTNNGVPYVLIPSAIVPAGSFPLNVEYYVSDRVTKPNPRLVVEVVTSGYPTVPAGTILTPDRLEFHLGRFKLDFTSSAGKTYYIQYSSSVAGPYETSFPGVAGTGGRLQWVDTGPPRTTSLPTAAGSRFYRLLQVP